MSNRVSDGGLKSDRLEPFIVTDEKGGHDLITPSDEDMSFIRSRNEHPRNRSRVGPVYQKGSSKFS